MPMVKKNALVAGNGNAASDAKIVAEKTPDVKADYSPTRYGKPLSQYEMELDKRIRYSGAYQAAACSPGLATMPFKTQDQFHEAIDKLALFILARIEG
jgi:hypothetical protein